MTVLETKSLICKRCGVDIVISVDAWEKRNSRGKSSDYCKDCTARPVTKEHHGKMICKPWMGELDLDTMTPIDSAGRPYMPGIRTCGHNDCVNSAHVFGREQAIAEQFSTFYRTGKKLNYSQLVKAIRSEMALKR